MGGFNQHSSPRLLPPCSRTKQTKQQLTPSPTCLSACARAGPPCTTCHLHRRAHAPAAPPGYCITDDMMRNHIADDVCRASWTIDQPASAEARNRGSANQVQIWTRSPRVPRSNQHVREFVSACHCIVCRPARARPSDGLSHSPRHELEGTRCTLQPGLTLVS